MTDHHIQLAIQVVPLSGTPDTYGAIDVAISVIQESGVDYLVTPMETIMQGPYEEVNKVARKAQEALAKTGCNEFLVNIKMHIRMDGDVTMEEKRLNR